MGKSFAMDMDTDRKREEGTAKMTNQELLLAISGVLQEQLTPVKTDIRELKEGMGELLRRMDGLEFRLDGLEQRVTALEQELSEVKQELSEVKQDLSEVKQKVIGLERQTRNLELTLENGVMPRLRTIEACYTSTYSRYADGIRQFDAMESDISLMKKVIMEHSEKLGTLS